MRFSHFTNLPPEVILRIFQHVDRFATVNAIVRTASIFHCVWLMNANTIALAVLPRAIDCYDEAHTLAEAQEWAEVSIHSSTGRRQSHRETIIVLIRRYLENSRLITGFYESNILPVLGRFKSIEGDMYARPLLERERFLTTLYHLKTLAVMHKTTQMSTSILSCISESELIDLSEVASWLRRRTHVKRRIELGVNDLLMESRWLQSWLDNHLAALHTNK